MRDPDRAELCSCSQQAVHRTAEDMTALQEETDTTLSVAEVAGEAAPPQLYQLHHLPRELTVAL